MASAKQIVSVAQLQDATGGYAFVSCKNENEPPYQAAIYMSFRLPQSNSVKYLRDVAASMAAHGWAPAASMGEHFGQKLTKDGVTAIFYRSVNDTDFATMRLYGECRNTADHRNDNPVVDGSHGPARVKRVSEADSVATAGCPATGRA